MEALTVGHGVSGSPGHGMSGLVVFGINPARARRKLCQTTPFFLEFEPWYG